MQPLVSKFVAGTPLTKYSGGWPDAWVDEIKTAISPFAPLSPVKQQCRVEIEFYLGETAYQNQHNAPDGSDLDNLLAPVFRGLERSMVISSDSHITEVSMKKFRAKTTGTPTGVLIRVYT